MYRAFLTLEDRRGKRLGLARLRKSEDVQRILDLTRSDVGTCNGRPGVYVRYATAAGFRQGLAMVTHLLRGRNRDEVGNIRAEYLSKHAKAQAAAIGLIVDRP